MPNIEEPHKFQKEVIEIGRLLLQSTGIGATAAV
jgi:hypothetical protein